MHINKHMKLFFFWVCLVYQMYPALVQGQTEQEFLKPDKAFQFSASVNKSGNIITHWVIADGYHLYRKRFKFSSRSQGFILGPPQFPAGETINDEFFGKMEVYHHDLSVKVPVQRGNATSKKIALSVTYQGCAQAGMCYPPMTKIVDLQMPVAQPAGMITSTSSGVVTSAKPPMSEQDSIARSLASGNVFVTLLAFFGFGLLLSFTPCVFPMIPILSSIIVGQGENITTRKAFVLSLVYILAVSFTYTLTGIAAGLLGENIQAALQNPWAIGSFAAIFVALSFSMFGFYDLQLPASLQSKLATISNNQQGGKLIGVAIMGLLSALIVGPCVAAPLAGALIYIGQTGDAVLGGMALFSLSLGMGVPLLVIGTSAGKLLPRAGSWMESIKAVFGVMLLGLAIWMLDRIVPSWVTTTLAATLIVISGVYLGALDGLGPSPSGWRRLWKGVGVVMLINGALMFVSLALSSGIVNSKGLLVSADAAGRSNTTELRHLNFTRVKDVADINHHLLKAKQAGQAVMLDFYADWCVSCKEMEKFTFSDPKIQAALKNTVLLQADVTKWGAADKALARKFQVIGPPAILFFDAHSGAEKRNYRVVGFMEANKFLNLVNSAIAN